MYKSNNAEQGGRHSENCNGRLFMGSLGKVQVLNICIFIQVLYFIEGWAQIKTRTKMIGTK